MSERFTKLDIQTKKLMTELVEGLGSYQKCEEFNKESDEEEGALMLLLKEIRENVSEMKEISVDINTLGMQKNMSSRVVDQAKTYSLTVNGLQASVRSLQMKYYRIRESRQRADLLSLSKNPFEHENRTNKKTGTPVNMSSDATDSLLRSRQILLETVQRSAGTLEQLAHTSSSIDSNQSELTDQQTIVTVSRNLLTKYGRREFTDKILIFLALAFFFACVGYIVHKRVF